MPTKKQVSAPLTTAQALGSLLKSARDIMRKDKGLNGDLDRLPLLTWVMFLKFLDDLEYQRGDEALLSGERFRPVIEAPYRWRDWAANKTGPTGDELLAFINLEDTVRPDGTRGPGLFTYLRKLAGSERDGRRDVVATVFRGVDNRMKSGYLLRDVIDKIDAIHFTASDELHTLGALYENLLREMRDAAGDSGEFYTPRAVVKLMVRLLDPQLGETVLDPASGTGGFLVEAYAHIAAQKPAQTVQGHRTLQRGTIFGCEPKSLPFLLCQMNLLLHGLDAPEIDPNNALRFKLSDIGERERVDVILSNPPFGGEEEKGIQANFPDDKQTSETALLFLQLIMRRLHRQRTKAGRSARAAVVVPDGTLFGDGVCARIKAELLRDFNLHTIVRLPKGVFSPYTDITTNILFFERGGPTRDVWYWEHQLVGGRKNYTKTKPLQFDEFAPLLAWWSTREEGKHAWKVSAEELIANGCNLDRKNPRASGSGSHQAPREIVAGVLDRQQRLGETLLRVQGLLQECYSYDWEKVPLTEVLCRSNLAIKPQADQEYKEITVRLWGKGVVERGRVMGLDLTGRRFVARSGQFIVSRIDARNGAMGLVPPALDGALVTNDFPIFDVETSRLAPAYLGWLCRTAPFVDLCVRASEGTTNRVRLKEQALLSIEIPLPPMHEQVQLVQIGDELLAAQQLQDQCRAELDALMPAILDRAFTGAL